MTNARSKRPIRRRLALALLVLLAAGCSRQTAKRELGIGAATSLRKALPAILDAFNRDHPGAKQSATYQSSGEIRRQLEAGADIDLVILASKDPVTDLIKSGHIEEGSARVVATNELVLVGPQNGPKLTFKTLQNLPPHERIAIGDPASVPAGAYAQKTLVALGTWDSLKDRLVLANNVAAVLTYATRGEAQAAIVYRTEIQDVKGIVELDTANAIGGPTPEIWAAVAKNTRSPEEAKQILDFLLCPEGKAAFVRFGFGPPPP